MCVRASAASTTWSRRRPGTARRGSRPTASARTDHPGSPGHHRTTRPHPRETSPAMMIHTSFTRDAILAAGRLAGVRFERLDQSGSRTHPRKFDVILSGSGGRANFGADHQAATWDEWGIFLNWIFWSDPNARAAGYYEDRERFRWATGNRFDTLAPAQQHR